MSKPNLDVAIGILVHQNQILVGWRAANQHQGNKHEFPGGKVEAGETPVEACRREIFEEVGLNIKSWSQFDFIRHEYDDVIVQLHFFISDVSTEQSQKIAAPWMWVSREKLVELNFPKANATIVKRLYWQRFIKISEDLSVLNDLASDRLLYWRTNTTENMNEALAEYSVEKLAKLIVNVEVWNTLTDLHQNAIQTIHLKQNQLLQLHQKDLIRSKRYIVACHNLEALQHAAQIGCDAAFLSPVLATQTHPDAQGLGWKTFADMASQVNMVVYALGGLSPNHLDEAIKHHAYGVAGIRSF